VDQSRGLSKSSSGTFGEPLDNKPSAGTKFGNDKVSTRNSLALLSVRDVVERRVKVEENEPVMTTEAPSTGRQLRKHKTQADLRDIGQD
jgi:hypothetical protein